MWKDVVGYEGLYQVSENGDIYSLKTKKILKQMVNHRGYMYVNLYKCGKMKSVVVHRIVAKAFIPNVDNKPQVNHIDGNKKNNSVYNLEWSTQSENQKHAFKTGLQSITQKQKEHAKALMLEVNKKKRKKVLQYDLEMNFIKEYESCAEAGKAVGTYATEISKCCRGKIKTCKGFIWKYAEQIS